MNGLPIRPCVSTQGYWHGGRRWDWQYGRRGDRLSVWLDEQSELGVALRRFRMMIVEALMGACFLRRLWRC